MRIETSNGVLEGDTITEIIEKHGKDCVSDTCQINDLDHNVAYTTNTGGGGGYPGTRPGAAAPLVLTLNAFPGKF